MFSLRVQNSSTTSSFRLWVYWALFCLAILIVFFPQLTYWPKVTQDEVQIIDLGRVVLNPFTDWSTGWLVHLSQPVFVASYIGTVAQELAYLMTAPSNIGPRMSSLFGAILAASLVLGWLKLRGTPPWVAWAISVMFLLDPIFNVSYRQGRVDSWAFCFIIAACLLLRLACVRTKSRYRRELVVFFAGIFTGAAPFAWPTTVALLPLVALELFLVARIEYFAGDKSNWWKPTSLLVWFGLGAVSAFLLCLMPVFDMWDMISMQRDYTAGIQKAAAVLSRPLIGMYAIRTPFIIPVIIVALLIKRDIGLIIVTTLALIMMFQTMMYPMRILYLLPLLAAIIASAFARCQEDKRIRWRSATLYSFFGLLLAWNAYTTLIERSVIAHHQRNASAQEHVIRLLSDSIGEGPHRVLLSEWDMYYAARALGWKAFRLQGRTNRGETSFKDFLGTIDYIIYRDEYSFFRAVRLEEIEKFGFTEVDRISFPQPEKTKVKAGPIDINIPEIVYKEVTVYSRNEN